MKGYACMIIAAVAATIAYLPGCGSVAVPPVDLPAPTIGRIDADGVSDAGKAVIIGEPGTVDQEAIDAGVSVMGINERLAASSAFLWHLTDLIASDAHAQMFPSICERVGFFCAEVAADGSFSLEVDAVVGDRIFIVLIDPDGDERSPRGEFIVPTSSHIASCVDTEAAGAITDLRNVAGYPVALYQGQGEIPNRIEIGQEVFEIPGCFARDLAVHIGPTGLYIAVVSPNDRVAWMGRWYNSQLVVAKTFVRDDTPMAIAFDGDPTHMLLAELGSSGLVINRVSLLEKTTTASLAVPDVGYTLDDAFGLQVVGPFADDGYLGTMMFSGYDGSKTEYSFVFFYTTTMANATVGGVLSVADDIFGVHSNPYEIADVLFGKDIKTTDTPVRYLLTDRGNHALYVAHVETSTFSPVLLGQMNAADLVGNVQLGFTAGSDDEFIDATVTPRRMALGVVATAPSAYVLTDELKLWKIANYAASGVILQGQVDLTGAVDPILIDVADGVESILVGDRGTNTVIDFSQFWGTGS